MKGVPIAGVLGCLLALAATAFSAPPRLADLLKALAHDEPAIRERAQAALLHLSLSELPALHEALPHPDPEVREQLLAALPALLNRQRVEKTLVSRPVRLRYLNATLEEILADAAEQTGIAVQLPDLPLERRWQRLTLDTGSTTPWDALYQVVQAANLRLEPAREISPVLQDDPATQARARFMWARRNRTSLPRIEPTPLRLLDGAEVAGVARWIRGPLCIEAGPVPGQAVVHPEPYRELTLPLTFQVEPQYALRGIVGVFLDEIRDDKGQRLPVAERIHDPLLGLDYFTIPRHLGEDELGRWWYRRRLEIPIRTLEKPARSLNLVRGRVMLGLQGPLEELARVRLVPGQPPPETTTLTDGGTLRFTKCENDGEGTWTLEVALTHPVQGSWIGVGTDSLVDRTGANSPVRLFDRRGNHIRPAGGIVDHRNERVCVIRVSFVATEAQDGAAELLYFGRRPIDMEVPFELKNIPLP